MANTFTAGGARDAFASSALVNVVDDYDDPLRDVDNGPTTLRALTAAVGSGSDVLALWDHRFPTIGSDEPDFIFPTGAAVRIIVLSGGGFENGLTMTVAADATIAGDPAAANTIQFNSQPVA